MTETSGVRASAHAAGTPLLRAVLSQARMELVLTLRQGESLLVTLGIPLGVLVFFSVVDVLPTTGTSRVEFLVPGVLAISVMSVGLVALAIQTAFERKYLVLKRLGATPLPRWALLAAKALAVLAALSVQTVLVIAVAALGLDWQPDGSVLSVVTALVLGTFAFSGLGLLLAGTIKAELVIGLANALFLVLLVTSGLAFDSGALPDAVATAGELTPSGALGVALREGMDGTWNQGALVILAAWGGLFALLASLSFRWEPS